MESLSDLLKTRMNAHNLSAPSLSAKILYDANLLLAQLLPLAPKSVRAYRLEQGLLYVSADNPVLSQELWGIQAQLLQKLKAAHGEKTVLKVIIKWLDPFNGAQGQS